jgi:hypothetical protein
MVMPRMMPAMNLRTVSNASGRDIRSASELTSSSSLAT